MEKPLKNAVALVIYASDGSRILIVKRPVDDDILPGVYGLPAGSLREGESWGEAARRAAREKLGVEISIKKEIGQDEADRGNFISRMREYEVEIVGGEPRVPQPVAGITQYSEWRWGEAKALEDAARKGSLCSKIYLQHGDKTS